MALDSGKLRHRVSLQRLTTTVNPVTGAISESWDEIAKLWAAIEPLSAREFVAAQAVQSRVTCRITIRHRAGVTARDRIEHNGTIYDIEGVLSDRDSGLEYLTLPCSSIGVNDG